MKSGSIVWVFLRPPVVCDHARPARPLSNLRKLRFPMELAWGEPIKTLRRIDLSWDVLCFIYAKVPQGPQGDGRVTAPLPPHARATTLMAEPMDNTGIKAPPQPRSG